MADSASRLSFLGHGPILGTEIIFDIPPESRSLDALENLYAIERVTIEADTGGTTLTPTLNLENTTLALATVNTSSRSMTEITVEKLGPMTGLTLSGDFTTNVQVFGVEIHIRPIVLGIVLADGQRININGRTNNAASSIIFDIDPHERRLDGGGTFLPVFDRFILEADTDDANVSPTMAFEDDTTITLDTFSSTIRERKVYQINRTGRIDQLLLSADYVTNAIGIYAAELYIRTMPLHIFFDGDE